MGVKLGDIPAIKALAMNHERTFDVSQAGKKTNYDSYKSMIIEKAGIITDMSIKIRSYMQDIEEYDRDMLKKTGISILRGLHPLPEGNVLEKDEVPPEAPQALQGPVQEPIYPGVSEDKNPELPAMGEGDNTDRVQNPAGQPPAVGGVL